MALHSNLIGGSTAKRALACPASIRLVAALPPAPESEYAAVGTALHAAAEYVMERNLADMSCVLGMEFHGIKITDELLDDKLVPALTAADALAETYSVHEIAWEQPVSFTGDLDGVFGSADLVMSSPDTLIIADYKFGDGVAVSPVNNTQGMFYAAAAMETAEIADMCGGRERVIIAVIQPTARGGDTLKVWETTREEVLALRPQLVDAIRRSRDPSEQPTAGEHCRWCPAAAVCDKAMADAMKALTLSPEDASKLSDAMALVDQVEAWAKSVKSRARQQLAAGRVVEGWKLVQRLGNRKWRDPAVVESIAAAAGIDAKEQPELASPAELERRCKKAGVKFEDVFGEAVTRTASDALAPADDPRETAIPLTALSNALGRLLVTTNNKR